MKIKIINANAPLAESWAVAVSRQDRGLDVSVVAQSLRTVNVLVNGSRPDLVVAEAGDLRDVLALENLANAHPEIDYVLVSTELAPEVLMRLMRAGVREVLPGPAAPEAVNAAVQRLLRKRAYVAAAPAQVREGRILSFVSCKGGSGATFVAANLANLLAAEGSRRVALIDLNLQFGDAVLFVSNEQQVTHVADVAKNIGRLDKDLLLSSMLEAAPGLFVLASPEDPAQSSEVQAEHVQAILKVAKQTFDYVVLDLGRSINAVSLQALDASDRVYGVLQLTLPFIRDGKRLREVFRSLQYPASKIHWVVNRYQKDSQITLEDLKRTLGDDDMTVLPNQYQVVAASVNQGVCVDKIAPNNPITKALRDLAASIAPPEDKPRAGGGWLAGLLRSGSTARAKGSDA